MRGACFASPIVTVWAVATMHPAAITMPVVIDVEPRGLWHALLHVHVDGRLEFPVLSEGVRLDHLALVYSPPIETAVRLGGKVHVLQRRPVQDLQQD